MQEPRDLGWCDVAGCELKAELMLRDGSCFCTDCYLDYVIKKDKEKEK